MINLELIDLYLKGIFCGCVFFKISIKWYLNFQQVRLYLTTATCIRTEFYAYSYFHANLSGEFCVRIKRKKVFNSIAPFCVFCFSPCTQILPMDHNPLGEFVCLRHSSHMTYPWGGSFNFCSAIHFDTSWRTQRILRKLLLRSRD